jgi:hypothetical protein
VNRWLARFSFTFLVVAGLLAWQGYRELTQSTRPNAWRVGLYFLAAGIGVGLAVKGVRERHRSDPSP